MPFTNFEEIKNAMSLPENQKELKGYKNLSFPTRSIPIRAHANNIRSYLSRYSSSWLRYTFSTRCHGNDVTTLHDLITYENLSSFSTVKSLTREIVRQVNIGMERNPVSSITSAFARYSFNLITYLEKLSLNYIYFSADDYRCKEPCFSYANLLRAQGMESIIQDDYIGWLPSNDKSFFYLESLSVPETIQDSRTGLACVSDVPREEILHVSVDTSILSNLFNAWNIICTKVIEHKINTAKIVSQKTLNSSDYSSNLLGKEITIYAFKNVEKSQAAWVDFITEVELEFKKHRVVPGAIPKVNIDQDSYFCRLINGGQYIYYKDDAQNGFVESKFKNMSILSSAKSSDLIKLDAMSEAC